MKYNKPPNRTSTAPPHPSLQGVQYVLFPYDPRIRRWDSFFLIVLSYYCFSIPYMIGVSGGYHMYKSQWWFAVNVVFNTVFFGEEEEWTEWFARVSFTIFVHGTYLILSYLWFISFVNSLTKFSSVDTIMQFFRAYRDENDNLVYNIRKIAWNYFTTSFAFNLIASFPSAVSLSYLFSHPLVSELFGIGLYLISILLIAGSSLGNSISWCVWPRWPFRETRRSIVRNHRHV